MEKIQIITILDRMEHDYISICNGSLPEIIDDGCPVSVDMLRVIAGMVLASIISFCINHHQAIGFVEIDERIERLHLMKSISLIGVLDTIH